MSSVNLARSDLFASIRARPRGKEIDADQSFGAQRRRQIMATQTIKKMSCTHHSVNANVIGRDYSLGVGDYSLFEKWSVFHERKMAERAAAKAAAPPTPLKKRDGRRKPLPPVQPIALAPPVHRLKPEPPSPSNASPTMKRQRRENIQRRYRAVHGRPSKAHRRWASR